MIWWVVLIGALFEVIGVSVALTHKWGRGSREGMSVNMETEAASRINYWHRF